MSTDTTINNIKEEEGLSPRKQQRIISAMRAFPGSSHWTIQTVPEATDISGSTYTVKLKRGLIFGPQKNTWQIQSIKRGPSLNFLGRPHATVNLDKIESEEPLELGTFDTLDGKKVSVSLTPSYQIQENPASTIKAGTKKKKKPEKVERYVGLKNNSAELWMNIGKITATFASSAVVLQSFSSTPVQVVGGLVLAGLVGLKVFRLNENPLWLNETPVARFLKTKPEIINREVEKIISDKVKAFCSTTNAVDIEATEIDSLNPKWKELQKKLDNLESKYGLKVTVGNSIITPVKEEIQQVAPATVQPPTQVQQSVVAPTPPSQQSVGTPPPPPQQSAPMPPGMISPPTTPATLVQRVSLSRNQSTTSSSCDVPEFDVLKLAFQKAFNSDEEKSDIYANALLGLQKGITFEDAISKFFEVVRGYDDAKATMARELLLKGISEAEKDLQQSQGISM